jgi:hypothetical protein
MKRCTLPGIILSQICSGLPSAFNSALHLLQLVLKLLQLIERKKCI